MQQISHCIDTLALEETLVVSIADSLYSTQACRELVSKKPNWVHLFRLNSTRNLYATVQSTESSVGNKKRYGARMKLNDAATHAIADEVVEHTILTPKGKRLTASIKRFNNRLLRGSRQFKGYEHPLTVLQVTLHDEHGNPVYKHPLWLGIAGNRRHEITGTEAYEYYKGRYDIEHFFRFGKDKLLLDAYQTPDVSHESAWWRLTSLSYVQLYLSRKSVRLLPKKWERYLPSYQSDTGHATVATPSQTQRGFSEVLNAIGTPAKPCVPRGNPKGRAAGEMQTKRQRHATIFKTQRKEKTGKNSIISDSEKSSNNSVPQKIGQLVSRVKTRLEKMDCTPKTFYELLLTAT